MPFLTQNLRYGWTALLSLGILTGITIFVVNNTRKQVKAEDIIEIVLATHERCLVTSYDIYSNYYVAPPSIIRTWTSNVYTTNGAIVYTNIITNTIGWHLDRAMMVELDSKIKSLVPLFLDTNSIYDGTTNFVALTVTGLWASLQIGDKTNKFTREPAWTNLVSTNWRVNYTSYWPSTSGVATNIIYTSDYQQVINYAASWTATGGHVWVASSNWASEVVTITNVATYGDYPWQIYTQDLEERYKVLYELKKHDLMFGAPMYNEANNARGFIRRRSVGYDDSGQTNWDTSRSIAEIHFSTNGGGPAYGGRWNTHYLGEKPGNYRATIRRCLTGGVFITAGHIIVTQLLNVAVFMSATPIAGSSTDNVFDANGIVNLPSNGINFGLIATIVGPFTTGQGVVFLNFNTPPNPCNDPGNNSPALATRGWDIADNPPLSANDPAVIAEWQFNYCTNKYW